jgi:hypothetical protein
MRSHAPVTLLAVTACAGLALGAAASPARGADPSPAGNYKLVLINPFTEFDLVLLNISAQGGKLRGEVRDAGQLRQPPQVAMVPLNDQPR